MLTKELTHDHIIMIVSLLWQKNMGLTIYISTFIYISNYNILFLMKIKNKLLILITEYELINSKKVIYYSVTKTNIFHIIYQMSIFFFVINVIFFSSLTHSSEL